MKWAELIFLSLGTYYDVKEMEIPGWLLTGFGVAAILLNIFYSYQTFQNAFLGACIGGIFLFVGWMTKEAIGYGDGLGLVILGIFEGWQKMIILVILSFLFSGIYGTWRLLGLRETRNETMPFYPFLLFAAIGVWLI